MHDKQPMRYSELVDGKVFCWFLTTTIDFPQISPIKRKKLLATIWAEFVHSLLEKRSQEGREEVRGVTGAVT